MAGKLATRKERAMELKLIRLQLRQIEERIGRLGGHVAPDATASGRLTGARQGLCESLRQLDEIDADKEV